MPTRQTKTKDRLKTAYIELLETTDFNHITVTALTNRAGVNRTTFYLNFTDIYAFEAWLETVLFQNVQQRLRIDPATHLITTASLTTVLAYLYQERRLIFAMIKGGLLTHLDQKIRQELVKIMAQELDADFTANAQIPAKYGQVAFAGAITAMIIAWIQDGMQESSQELAAMLTTVRTVPLGQLVFSRPQ